MLACFQTRPSSFPTMYHFDLKSGPFLPVMVRGIGASAPSPWPSSPSPCTQVSSPACTTRSTMATSWWCPPPQCPWGRGWGPCSPPATCSKRPLRWWWEGKGSLAVPSGLLLWSSSAILFVVGVQKSINVLQSLLTRIDRLWTINK